MSDDEYDDDGPGGGPNEDMGMLDERGFPINMTTGNSKLAPQHNPMAALAAKRKKEQEARLQRTRSNGRLPFD